MLKVTKKRSKLTREKDLTTRAGEMFGLMRLAHILDVVQSKVENYNLDEAREGCGNNLGHEHRSRRNLHVVSKLQVTDEA
jgi:hypothetical protein